MFSVDRGSSERRLIISSRAARCLRSAAVFIAKVPFDAGVSCTALGPLTGFKPWRACRGGILRLGSDLPQGRDGGVQSILLVMLGRILFHVPRAEDFRDRLVARHIAVRQPG